MTTVDPHDPEVVEYVKCPDAAVPLSGGWQTLDSKDSTPVTVTGSRATESHAEPPNAWRFDLWNASGDELEVELSVRCAVLNATGTT